MLKFTKPKFLNEAAIVCCEEDVETAALPSKGLNAAIISHTFKQSSNK